MSSVRVVLPCRPRHLDDIRFNLEVNKLVEEVKLKCPELLAPEIEPKLSYSWDTSFDKHLFNIKKTLENTSEDMIFKDLPCGNKICTVFRNQTQYHSDVTGSCINTDDVNILKDILPLLKKECSKIPLSGKKAEAGMKNIIFKLSSNLKTRPPTPIPAGLVEEACLGVEEWLNRISKSFRTRPKDPFLGDSPSERTNR